MIGGHSSEPTLVLGTETVLLPTLRPDGRSAFELRHVWFAPTAPYSHLSLNRLEELGIAYDLKNTIGSSAKESPKCDYCVQVGHNCVPGGVERTVILRRYAGLERRVVQPQTYAAERKTG